MARCSATTRSGKHCTRAARARGLCTQHGTAPAVQSVHLKKGANKPRAGSAAAAAVETAENKEKFLAGFGQIATVTGACEHAGIGRQTHYNWLEDDADYAAAFGHAKEEANDRLEGEARRRAVAGTEEPVFYQGEEISKIRRYSDTLLIFLLKGAKPETYRERHEVTGAGGGPIQHSTVDLAALSVETLKRIKKEIAAARAAK